MKICNRTGCGVCVNCNGVPPIIDGYNYGDICRKTAQSIMDEIEDGGLYRFKDGKLYGVEVFPNDILDEWEVELT